MQLGAEHPLQAKLFRRVFLRGTSTAAIPKDPRNSTWISRQTDSRVGMGKCKSGNMLTRVRVLQHGDQDQPNVREGQGHEVGAQQPTPSIHLGQLDGAIPHHSKGDVRNDNLLVLVLAAK